MNELGASSRLMRGHAWLINRDVDGWRVKDISIHLHCLQSLAKHQALGKEDPAFLMLRDASEGSC